MNDTAPSLRLPQVRDSLGGALMRVCLNQMRTLPDVWQKIPEEQQQGCIELAREALAPVVRQGIRDVLAFGFPHVEVALDSMTAKESGTKLALHIADPAALQDLLEAVGRKCVLVLIDPDMFAAGMEGFKADADQPELPLEDGDADETE